MFLACLGLGARNDGLCVTLLVVIMIFFSIPSFTVAPFCFFLSSHYITHFPSSLESSPLSFFVVRSSCLLLNFVLPMSRFFFLLFPTLCVLCALAFRVALFQAFSFARCSFFDRP